MREKILTSYPTSQNLVASSVRNFLVRNTNLTDARGTEMQKLDLQCPNEGLRGAVMQHITGFELKYLFPARCLDASSFLDLCTEHIAIIFRHSVIFHYIHIWLRSRWKTTW